MARDLAVPAATYPAISSYSFSPEEYIPSGWQLETKVTGDLNRDGISDVVLVMRCTEPANVLKNGSREELFDTNPRILAVAFGNGTAYNLAAENHEFIPRSVDPHLEDFFDATSDGILIENGALKVTLRYFSGAGDWTMQTRNYTFQWQNDSFELIGLDIYETDRSNGKTEDTMIDYSTGKVEIATGNIESDERSIHRQTLPEQVMTTLDEIGDGIEFKPLK